jgi:hypothetical protein
MITVHEKASGQQINVYVGEFKGHQLLHIREWYVDKESGKLMPGKGVAMPISKADVLRAAIDEIMIGEQ